MGEVSCIALAGPRMEHDWDVSVQKCIVEVHK